MQNEPRIPSQTPEQIIAQIAGLMAEAEALVAGPELGHRADVRFRTLRGQLRELQGRVAEAYGDARRRVLTGVRATDEAIQAHPYRTAAIALGAGLVLGAMISAACRDRA